MEGRQEITVIPDSLQIDMDDLGWFCGKDDRAEGGSSRTGMGRRHCAADYEAVNELGKRLDMKINCAFVIGEWDPDNRLRGIPGLSKYHDAWDNAARFDREEMERCVDVINRSAYIDPAIHGLLHGNYREGIDNCDTSDYYYRIRKRLYMVEESQVRQRLDAFLDLWQYHGIQKKINSMIPPSFAYRRDELSRILKEYGIQYISTIFHEEGNVGRPEERAFVEQGIITVNRNLNLIPWNETGSDPRALPTAGGIFGCHWSNVLHEDPERYSQIVEHWVSYFERCAETFGIILSQGKSFCATQSLYKQYGSLKQTEREVMIDISKVPKAAGKEAHFYISSRRELVAESGCQIREYRRHKEFIHYEAEPTADYLILRYL